jgi:hypothetical protein
VSTQIDFLGLYVALDLRVVPVHELSEGIDLIRVLVVAVVVASNDVSVVSAPVKLVQEVLAETTCSQIADLLSAVDQVAQVHDVTNAA